RRHTRWPRDWSSDVCSSDLVSKNDEFLSFAEAALEAVEADGPEAVSSVEERRLELIAKIGENVELAGAARMEAGDGELLAEYVQDRKSTRLNSSHVAISYAV